MSLEISNNYLQAIISLDRGCRLSPPLLIRQVFRRHLRSQRSSYRTRVPADHVSSHEYVSSYVSRLRINTYHRYVSSIDSAVDDRSTLPSISTRIIDHVSTRIIDHVSTRIDHVSTRIATYHRSTLPSTISSGDPAIIFEFV